MDLTDFIPFKTEFAKAYYGLTGNATHTSETPVFNELKVRRYELPAQDLSEFITDKVERWVGWNFKNEKTAVGGMTVIRAEVISFALLGMKIDVTFGLHEEKDVNGRLITTVNAKALTNIESKGDLGESRRVIRMMLGALDFEFRKQIINEEDYHYRSVDPKGSTAAFQQIFNEAKLQNRKKADGSPKAKAVEFKKKNPVQTIPFKTASRTPSENDAEQKEKPGEQKKENGTAVSVVNTGNESPEAKPSKPKFTIITKKPT
ncbi:MAG: hypothetical protein FJZ79_03190 [Chlorobi bacterium]|nr:hypothetical protein [Chlorobiota bacterium]